MLGPKNGSCLFVLSALLVLPGCAGNDSDDVATDHVTINLDECWDESTSDDPRHRQSGRR